MGGHSIRAENELISILESEVGLVRERCFAGWHLGRWYHFNEQFERALDIVRKVREIDEAQVRQKRFVMLESFCHIALSDTEKAATILSAYLLRKPKDSDALLAASNVCCSTDHDKINFINSVYKNNQLCEVGKIDENLPLSIANIKGVGGVPVEGELVSVIMPIFNAEKNIDAAIHGLLNQTWKNIEIIAVDDVSTDGTFQKLVEWSEKDPRVIPVKRKKNGGAYAARNEGLKLAKGDFITTHDSDDWSHPQKIQIQVQNLQSNPRRIGVLTYWIRCRNNLEFTQNWRLNSELIHWSHSSFLFRSHVLDIVGGWDPVMIGGDTEFIWRIERTFGAWSVKKIHKNVPFSFALDEETSLTRTKATHVKTIHYGLRHMYREACAWWHRSRSKKELSVVETSDIGERMFPAPERMLTRDTKTICCNYLLAGDFSQAAACEALENFCANIKPDDALIAVFHWPNYLQKIAPIRDVFFELVYKSGAEIVVAGQTVVAKNYIVLDRSLLDSDLDSTPEFEGFKEWEVFSAKMEGV